MSAGGGPGWSRGLAAALALGAVGGFGLAQAGDERIRAEAGRRCPGEPLVRIGLEPAESLRVDATGPYRIVDPGTGRDVWKPRWERPVAVVVEGAEALAALGPVYRIQVGSFATQEAAEAERRRLTNAYGVEGVVRHVPDRDAWRVRLGGAPDRKALAEVLRRLREDGRDDAWIVEEPPETDAPRSLRLVDTRYESVDSGRRRLLIVPEGRGRVRLEEMEVRGVVELRADPYGRVRAVNWVGLESYLRGVVPAELGPEVWPQLEALKAQAVAARTYVWKHLGQFEASGFDLCATPRCQVYKGVPAEHPLTDRAVAETRGEILTWEGEPITALYTATCGGHTEDAAEIFPEEAAPYLVGVPCRAEADARRSRAPFTLEGSRAVHVTDETGTDVSRAFILLHAAGVAEGGSADRLGAPVTTEEMEALLRRFRSVAGLPDPGRPLPRVRTVEEAAEALVSGLGWTARADVLLDSSDIPALLRSTDTRGLSDRQRRSLAYLAWLEALRPFPDGGYGVGRPMSRARLLAALEVAGDLYEVFDLKHAVVMRVEGAGVVFARGKGQERVPLAPRPALMGWSAGRWVPVTQLGLWPGDRVAYRTGPGGRVDYLELRPPVKGTADDRHAVRYAWEERRSRASLEAAVNRRVAVGTLRDLEVTRRGRSGRVVELRVIGSRGDAVVRGFDIRRLLGIPETFTVFEIQRDPQGAMEAVVFAGKGWGHGVGLCQVGAYGMALRGRNYREILHHYYRGAKIQHLEFHSETSGS